MPAFGDYETVGEPVVTRDERGHVSIVWQARKSRKGGGRLYAIKCYAPHRRKPEEGQPDDAFDEDRGRKFLEGIKQLKRAHSEERRYLAPVHAFGIADTGAWYATDFYPRNTLDAWIAESGGVDRAAVRHVVYSAVRGCLALKRSRGYSHGNLKSGNVFLAGKPRPLRHTPLHLADPYPAAPSQLSLLEGDVRHKPGEPHRNLIEARDLRALGELIFELVEGRPIQKGYDYYDPCHPVLPSLAWGCLGKDGTRWRLLCNRLLDPQLSLDEVNLESLAKEFRPNPVMANLPMILTVLASLCLLAVSGLYGTQWILKSSAERRAAGQRQFGVVTNAAWAAYRAGDFTNAIAEADKALAIHGDDAGIRKLKEDARARQAAAARQAERERRFGLAAHAAWTAYRTGDFTNAIAEADKALAIHGDDAGIRKLKEDARARQAAAARQAEQERQFGLAAHAAWAAYRAGDFTNAIAEADKALAIHEDDAGIRKLKEDARAQQAAAARQAEQERQFGVATNAAWAAYRAGDFTNAIAEADKALAIHKDDAGIRKLKEDALARQAAAARQAEQERQFGVATNAAWAAYRAGDFTNAIATADQALAIHEDDAAIGKLKEDARAQQAAATRQAEQERQFGVATNAAWAAYRAGDFTNTIATADQALAIHEDDAGMIKLKTDARARLSLAKGNGQQPGTPSPLKNVPGPERPDLAQLDTTLEMYEVLFRIKPPPAPNIVDKHGTQLKPLPLTLIPLDQKEVILIKLKGLESGYQTGGWLQEREKRLQNLRRTIRNW